jgi:hypothetical protein
VNPHKGHKKDIIMARYTITNLRQAVTRYNGFLCGSGSNWFFVESGRNGYQAVDLHYIDESGRTICQRMLVGGTSRECQLETFQEYNRLHATLNHTTKPTRIMAKTILAREIDFSSDFHTLKSDHVNDIAIWAKVTKYRKPRNANGSLARYFFNHLSNKVSV